MRKIKLLDCAEAITVSVGASGTILFFLGAGSCFLGVSGKAVDKLAQVLKPHQSTAQKMVNYGAGATFAGLLLAAGGVVTAKTVGEYLGDKEFQERAAKTKYCNGCIYYSANTYLSCAVHPSLPKDCRDFTSQ